MKNCIIIGKELKENILKLLHWGNGVILNDYSEERGGMTGSQFSNDCLFVGAELKDSQECVSTGLVFVKSDEDIAPEDGKQYLCKTKDGKFEVLYCIFKGQGVGYCWGKYDDDWDYDIEDVTHYIKLSDLTF